MASKAMNTGIVLFNLVVPSANIFQDEFVNLLICYKCYALEEHTTASCTKPINYKVCSLCSQTGHTFKECQAYEKTCINCKGPHSTLAMSCPHRKRIQKEKKTKSVKKPSYSSVAASNVHNVSDSFGNASEVIAKAAMCIMISTMKNGEIPGSFQHTLNHLLQANNLPKFNMGQITPPSMMSLSPTLSNKVNSGNNMEAPVSDSDDERTSSGSEDDVGQSNSISIKTRPQIKSRILLLKKKYTRDILPINIEDLHRSGNVIIECTSASESECIRYLSGVSEDEFNRMTEVTELKAKEFEQRSKATNNGNNKRKTRNNAASNVA